MAQKKFSELETGSVDGTSIFAQTKTEDGSLVSKSASSTALAGYIGTSHQFAGLSTNAKNLVGAINEAASMGGVVQLTQAEYDLLDPAVQANGSIYKITDNAKMYCLDEEYHAVKELTTAQYEALSTAEQNNGTIYIQTDAETTGEDINVSSTDTRTIDEGIADADGQVIDYSTWQNMTAEQKEAAGKVFVPDFPTATPNATEIPMSSSESTSIAGAINGLGEVTTGQATLDTTKIDGGGISYTQIGKLVIVDVNVRFKANVAADSAICSGLPSGSFVHFLIGVSQNIYRAYFDGITIKMSDVPPAAYCTGMFVYKAT